MQPTDAGGPVSLKSRWMAKTLYSKVYELMIELLREERLSAGQTQAQLAEALNVPQSYVSKSESGARRLDMVEVRAWLGALDRSFVEFAATLDERASGHEALVKAGTRRTRRKDA